MSADMTGPKEPNSAVLYGVHLTTSAYTAVFAEYLPPWEEAEFGFDHVKTECRVPRRGDRLAGVACRRPPALRTSEKMYTSV